MTNYYPESEEIEETEIEEAPKRSRFRKWAWLALGLLFLVLASGGYLAYKANLTLSKISTQPASLWKNIIRMLPLEKSSLLGRILPVEKSPFEEERINLLLLGIRGIGDPHGGLLTDTLMVISLKPETEEVAMISIPRDIYLEMPGQGISRKINEAYGLGEGSGYGGGLTLAKKAVSRVTGLKIHYAFSIDFRAFKEIIDALGGITVYVPRELRETGQWSGYEFYVPVGYQKMDGETALFYARARFSTSDFDRARRQQEILIGIKNKAWTTGTLINPIRINALLNAVGRNVRTDLEAWEMKELIELAQRMKITKVVKKVFDTTSQGLLYSTFIDEAYVLLPVGDNFDKIQETCQGIFD
ncbi:MAG TPA: LytR family transcriptional regulator [Candidatus Portnoybacteria bacterium]|nr:LytR family transcriptional regulator [Candidatus Portnoybacteria bacterium]